MISGGDKEKTYESSHTCEIRPEIRRPRMFLATHSQEESSEPQSGPPVRSSELSSSCPTFAASCPITSTHSTQYTHLPAQAPHTPSHHQQSPSTQPRAPHLSTYKSQHDTSLLKSSQEFSWQGYWSELPFPSPGGLPDPGIEPESPAAPTLTGMFFTAKPLGKPL